MTRLVLSPAVAVALLACAGLAAAQERIVSGRIVVQGTDAPLGNAGVHVVGRDVGVCTTQNGEFALAAPAGATELELSVPGWTGRVWLAPSQSDVTLKIDSRVVATLPELVVTAQAAPPIERSEGNAVARIEVARLRRPPAGSIETMLAGLVPGLRVTRPNVAGRGSQIQIRGVNSITGSTSPVFVIDGVMIAEPPTTGAADARFGSPAQELADRIAEIDPNDVESIRVLRGASAAARYGPQAANGVILITTRRGLALPEQVRADPLPVCPPAHR